VFEVYSLSLTTSLIYTLIMTQDMRYTNGWLQHFLTSFALFHSLYILLMVLNLTQYSKLFYTAPTVIIFIIGYHKILQRRRNEANKKPKETGDSDDAAGCVG
jgi:DNA phosphorothioation-dependent restriction protein DptG